MRHLVVLSVVMFVLLFGCNTKHYEKEVAQVDSLLHVMQNANEQLMTLDGKKIADYHDKSEQLLQYIDQNYKDTMELETAVLISDYSYIKKVLGKYDKQKEEYGKLMAFNTKQLNALKEDLKHGVLKEDSIPIFMETETKAVDGLNKTVLATVEKVENQLIKYDSLHPRVQQIVEELKVKVETE